MTLTSLVQDAGPSSASRGTNVLLFLALVIGGLIYLMWRRRAAPTTPMLPPPAARAALERIEREGTRDLRTEGHVRAFLTWCRAYAVLTVISCAAIAYLPKKNSDPDQVPPDRGTLAMFGGIALVEGLGIWAGLRMLDKGRPAGRWISCAAVSAVSLSGAVAVTLRILRWSEDDTVNGNLVGHGALALYALAGATFLLLPRAGRLFTPEYRATTGGPETPELRAATMLARAKSPFSWLPVILIVALFVLQLINRDRG
jgi:hypothetical protein